MTRQSCWTVMSLQMSLMSQWLSQAKELEALDIKDPTTGKIDYREKRAYDSVTKDTLLGHQIPEGEIELSLGERAPDV